MVEGLDVQLVAHGGSRLRGRACRDATVEQWCKQFREAFAIQVTLSKFLHPSRRKRQRIRARPESALTYTVSTVLTDMRKIARMGVLIKGLVAVVCLQMLYRERRVE